MRLHRGFGRTKRGQIDAKTIEELEDERIQLDYDMDATECSLEMEGLAGIVEIKPSSISLTQTSDVSPKDLLQSFLDMQEMMLSLKVT